MLMPQEPSLPASLLHYLDHTKLPPVEQWHPPCAGNMPLRIAYDGTWHHENRPIERAALVKLFAGILRRDDDGHYYLVTPVECWRIDVEDVPFIAVEMQTDDESLYFRSNVDDWVCVGADHPLRIDEESNAPYVHIRGRLEARLNRAIYYELAERAVERDIDGRSEYAVYSQGVWFPLGGDVDAS
jgi:hypothetical protein